MPTYNYECLDCQSKATKKGKIELTKDEYESLVLFETSHRLKPTPEELKEAITCPRCNGTNCQKTIYGSNVIGYIKGNGFLDKAGVHRDMNLFHLTEKDPYAQYRVPGEVDDMKAKLKRGGQRKTKKIINVPQKTMEKAVGDAVIGKKKSN